MRKAIASTVESARLDIGAAGTKAAVQPLHQLDIMSDDSDSEVVNERSD